ncbi:MAG: Na+/H+ antiporter NhaC family protein [Haemophilus parainfluenzae]
MCVMMPVSSWGAYIITLVAGLLATYSITSYTPMGAFVAIEFNELLCDLLIIDGILCLLIFI